MARNKSFGKEERFQPNFNNYLDFVQYIHQETGYYVRYTTTLARGDWKVPTLQTVIQLYNVMEGRPWVLAERMFYWPNNEGREFTATLQLELHRAWHKWDAAMHDGPPDTR